jgi:hypothetical protein
MKYIIDDIYETIANNKQLDDDDKNILIDMIQDYLYQKDSDE